jgi:protein TonB
MVNTNRYFYLSGALSFLLFLFFLSIVFFMMMKSDKTKIFALKKDNYISVSIDMSVAKARKTLKQTPEKSLSEVVQEDTPPEDLNIDSLFSDVWTQKIKTPKTKPVKQNPRKLQEIQKQLKKVKKNDVKSVSEMFENINTKKVEEKSTSKSSGTEVNEYLAKIQALVYSYFYPPPNSEGNSVKAVITLSALGKVQDFRILNYSANEALNKESDLIKDRLKNVVFPKNPDNNSGTYIIILTAQE